MSSFESIQPGARIKGLDATGTAEAVSVSRFGALTLVFRVAGKVAERLVDRGEESSFEFISGGRAYVRPHHPLDGLPPLIAVGPVKVSGQAIRL